MARRKSRRGWQGCGGRRRTRNVELRGVNKSPSSRAYARDLGGWAVRSGRHCSEPPIRPGPSRTLGMTAVLASPHLSGRVPACVRILRMRITPTILLILTSVSLAGRAAEVTPPAVPLKIHRAPADLVKQGGMEPDEERTLPALPGSCEGTLAVRALGASLEIRTSGSTIAIYHHGEVTVEKLKEGPLAAPVLEVTTKGQSGVEKVSFVLETMMTSPSWEKGGAFRETFSGET